MKKSVDNIPYLCCIADTGKFYGINSWEYEQWLKKQDKEFEDFLPGNTKSKDAYFIDRFIPLFDKNVKSDIDMLTLPKVFRAKKHVIERIHGFTQKMSMDISINWDKNLVLVL